MKKTLLTLAVAALTLTVSDTMAQDKAATDQTEKSAENVQKEADAIAVRIKGYVEKLEANKDNPEVDYEAGMAQVDEMRTKWESLTGKKWKDEAKKD